jgi:hypothetical protein
MVGGAPAGVRQAEEFWCESAGFHVNAFGSRWLNPPLTILPFAKANNGVFTPWPTLWVFCAPPIQAEAFWGKARPTPGDGASENHAQNREGDSGENDVKRDGSKPGQGISTCP